MNDAQPALLALEEVSVTVGGATLLDDITWRVRRGERWVVLGPNGAGKTTLLQVASTYRYPSRGAVWVLDERVGRVDVRQLRRRVGYASAELERMLDDRLTAHDAVVSALAAVLVRWRGVYRDVDHQRAAALLRDLGVGPMARRRIASLSEGERRRVQIARALMAEPDLLLLDEPAAGLDIAGRERLLEVLTALAGDRHLGAIVFVTHHVEEIPPGFTHVLLLTEGAVVAAGPLGTTLTSETLSRCVGLDVDLSHVDGRFGARRARREVS
ncbi:MAG: ATP-binding cassette domain-containing protein [Actinobacteria bacterium]|nr:ATP-binding cassette domain-containing protein [Actinomycetota bacterium]